MKSLNIYSTVVTMKEMMSHKLGKSCGDYNHGNLFPISRNKYVIYISSIVISDDKQDELPSQFNSFL